MATSDRLMTLRTRHGRFTVRHALLIPAVMRYVRTLDLVVERRNCGANAEGGGGFQPGNTCGKGEGSEADGEDSTQNDLLPHGTSGDSYKPSVIIKSKSGEIIETDRQDVNGEDYLDEAENDAVDRGIVADFDTAKWMQEYNSIETDDAAVQAYVGAAYGYFTGHENSLSGAEEIIDAFGYDYGTIDADSANQIVNEKMDEVEQEWDALDKTEYLTDGWESWSDEEKNAAKDEWLNDKRLEIEEEIEQTRSEARDYAVRQMTKELESGSASSTIECCVQLYRGLSVSQSTLDSMVASGAVSHTGVNSWTTSRSVAKGFSGGGGEVSVVLISRSPRVGLINVDDQMSEREVIRPPSKMRIQRIVKTKTKVFLYVDEDEDYK